MCAWIFWSLVCSAVLWFISDEMERHRQYRLQADRLQAEADKRHWDEVFARIEGRVTDAEEG